MRAHRLEALAALVLALAIVLPGLGRPTLIDPWETHYAEVGRRVLEDADWVRLQWADEGFRSKPALAPWLIAASLRAHGLAEGGGTGPELTGSRWTAWAARLPFALASALGLLALFLVTRRLASRGAAWLALLVNGTCALPLLLSRQAITDGPMVATTGAAIGLLALALLDGARPARAILRGRGLRGWTGPELVQAAIVLTAGGQLIYGSIHLGSHPAPGAGGLDPRLLVIGPGLLGLLALVALWRRFTAREARHGHLYAAYALLGVGVLGKGPPGLALAALTGLGFVIAERRWRALLRVRALDGLLIVLVIAGPWHVAMALEDGVGWVTEYIGHHWLGRAAGAAHSANEAGTETFRYYVEQLGYGLLPWTPLAPAAIGAAITGRPGEPPRRAAWRRVALLWALLGLAFFTGVGTRFHHYVAPAVGGLAALIGLWIDDAARGRRAPADGPLLLLGAALTVPIARDLAADPAIFLELVTYRYDRPWPPSIDLRPPLAAILALAGLAAALAARWPRALAGSVAAAGALWLFLAGPYLEAAAPHWGQRALARTYYRERGPDDPLVAWQLYWRGEVFWTAGEVIQQRQGDAASLRDAAARHPDASRIYVVTEAGRREAVRASLDPARRASFEVEDKSSHKFVLVSFARAP